MSKFDKSRWAESDFSQGYRDEADAYLPYRRTFIEMTTLFYEHFLSQNTGNKVLDLGCGDGFFIEELLKADTQINAVLIDGSQEIMTAAKERLTNHENIQLIQATFQELLTDKPIPEDFDFIFSSLAVHHLTLNEKIQLYNFIHDHLKPGGCFINFDVVLAPTDDLESWYASIWSKWIECQVDLKNRKKLMEIPQLYKDNLDNTPDTLKSQIEALEKIGFQNVDCYFKYGIFSLFGGNKRILT